MQPAVYVDMTPMELGIVSAETTMPMGKKILTRRPRWQYDEIDQLLHAVMALQTILKMKPGGSSEIKRKKEKAWLWVVGKCTN